MKKYVNVVAVGSQGDKLIEFGRPPVWNCPMPEEDEAPAPQPTLPAQQPVRVAFPAITSFVLSFSSESS